MMTVSKWRLGAAFALTCLLGAGAPAAYADTTDDLLLKLKEKGILTEEEYQQLATRKAAQAGAAIATAPATTAVTTTAAASTPTTSALPLAPKPQIDETKLVHVADTGVGLKIGDVNVAFSGSVNGAYVHDSGDANTANHQVTGGVASLGPRSSAVRNGLLPGFFKIDVTTQQSGWDVGAHFGLYPGIDSVTGTNGANSTGAPVALATSGIDFRQVYLNFSRPHVGEIKIGRDIGLFGSDAILNDITLLSVGGTGGNVAPSNTSLGRIGLGYIYADFQPQITYTTPKWGGFQIAAGVFQPLETTGNSEVNKKPGFQAKVTYDYKADTWTAHAWVSAINQEHDGIDASPSYTGNAVDGGVKLGFGGLSLVGYYYTGSGVGTTGLFILSTDADGSKRDSNGFYVQASYAFSRFTLAASYGESHLSLASGEVNPELVDKNGAWVGQGRYQLTKWVTLFGEYVLTKSEAHGPNQATSNAITTGAILVF